MAQKFDSLDDSLCDFILEQPLLLAVTAERFGRVNMSPKDVRSIRILGPRTMSYYDFDGGEPRTSAHLCDDNRITFIFSGSDGSETNV